MIKRNEPGRRPAAVQRSRWALARTTIAMIVALGAIACGTMPSASASAADAASSIGESSALVADIDRMTPRRFWHLDRVCRGGSNPHIYLRACRMRDRFLRAQGRRTAARFHEAWRQGDRRAMARIATSSTVMAFFRGRASGHPMDCEYLGDPAWYCYMRSRRGSWVGVRFEITRWAPPRLPRWQATGAAPDCC